MASASGPKAGELTAALEAALVRELQATYAWVNAAYFKRALAGAVISLAEGTGRLGAYLPDLRAIELSRAFVLEKPWGSVVEVLKHEMAHQYASEVLRAKGETSHGPAFRRTCERLGIDARASGVPAEGKGPEGETARVLERVAKLLALAESSSEHEAQAAMSAAQRLMLKYNLEASRAPRQAYAFRHLGKPSGRVQESERILAALLAKHFFVEAIWVPVYRPLEGKRGSVLEICGTPENLEMASYVHAFLTHAAESLWAAHKKENGVRGDRDRRSFVSGVMTGFLEKLNRERQKHREEGLVWIRDADLEGFYRRRHPHIHHVRHQGQARTEAHARGREAGRKIVLHRPVEGGPTGSVRLLKG